MHDWLQARWKRISITGPNEGSRPNPERGLIYNANCFESKEKRVFEGLLKNINS